MPTLDTTRGQIYFGTGEAYTSPAADTSDAVLAIDASTGERRWAYQSISGDAWNMACFIGGGPNCPVEDGPDLDIGAPPMLLRGGARDLVVAGQKSGHVFALDPDDGSLVWRVKIGRGGFAGGVHWGMATDGQRIYAPNADTVFTGRFTGERKPGLFALDPADGSTLWFAPAPDVCAEADKPACDPGFSAAVTAIPGVVFAGAFDGHLRAYDAASGALLWDFDTNRAFDSVSGDVARGGSIESDGPVVYRGHVAVNSGYLFGDRMPGNALVVFTPEAQTP
jgi:polyvinyl alcohol dehydrogenase (cytochrome)